MTQDVSKQMARGAAWMLLFKFLDRGIGFISTLVLARVLTPDSFGIVAMAMSFIALLELLGAFGFDAALIQRADATPDHYNTAWTFNVIIGVAIATLMLIFAEPVADYYNHPELAAVIRALAISSFLQGFSNIGTVAFRKELNFRKEFIFLLSKRLITFPVTIGLAFALRNYWALVIGVISGRVLEVMISYLLHPYRPRFGLRAAHDLLHFSKWLLLLNILAFIKDRSHDFIIGRMVGARGLGLFNVTHELASLPGTELVAPISRAVYPVYAKIAGDLNALRREYLSVMAVVTLLAVPAVAGVAATAKLLVPTLLGPQWLEAVPILQLLAFYGITQVMQSNAYSLCLAIGKGKTFVGVLATHAALLLPSIAIFTQWKGLIGAAIGYVLAAVIMLPVAFSVILRMLSIPVGQFLSRVWRPLAAAACMYVVVVFAIGDVDSAERVTVMVKTLIGAVLLGIATYAASAYVLWVASGRPDGAESAVLNKCREFLRMSPRT